MDFYPDNPAKASDCQYQSLIGRFLTASKGSRAGSDNNQYIQRVELDSRSDFFARLTEKLNTNYDG